MKASSSGLEVWIMLSEKQINNLETIPIEGILKFREVTTLGQRDSKERDIPIQLKYARNQIEGVEVDIIPDKTYFGKADKIVFNIDGEYYQDLKKYSQACCRFLWYGKLTIRSEKKRLLSQRFL